MLPLKGEALSFTAMLGCVAGYALLRPDAGGLLWFSDVFTTLGVMLLAAGALGFGVLRLRRAGVDGTGLALYAAAGVLGLWYIHVSHDDVYTNDLGGHVARIHYTVGHWLSPYGYHGFEDHHPPLYYYVAALAVQLAQWKAVPELTALRFLSWCSSLVFYGYGLLIVRQAGLRGAAYAGAAVLFLLWPANMHMAGKINSEAMYFSLYAASFYYGLRWWREGRPRDLRVALALAAVAVLVRSNAVMLYAALGVILLAGGRRRAWLALRQCGWRVAVLTALCWAGNLSRVWLPGDHAQLALQFGDTGGAEFGLWHFLSFDPVAFITQPFVALHKVTPFWNVCLSDFIFGIYDWGWPLGAAALNLLLLMVLLYMALGWALSDAGLWRGMLPYAMAVGMAFPALMVFAWWKQWIPDQEMRYVYPMLPCFAVLYGKAQAAWALRGHEAVARGGVALAGGFALLGAVFFTMQAR